MTKTKSQKARARALKAKNAAPASVTRSRRSRGNRIPKMRMVVPFIGPKLSKAARRGRARKSLNRSLEKGFVERIQSDGLNQAMKMHNSSARVDHFPRRMEKVADISVANANFSVLEALYLNPGNSVLFPIFSQIASVYEQCKWKFLKFHFITEAYTASGSNFSAGKIIMATDLNPSNPQFVSATQAENYVGADRDAPFKSFTHDVLGTKAAAMKLDAVKSFYVYPSANGAAPSGDNSKFYDLGLFQFMVSGIQGTGEAGELYVEFECDLINPKQQTPLGENFLAAHLVESPAGTAAAANPFGTSGASLRSGSTLQVSASGTNGIIIPTPGQYLVAITFNGSVTASTITPGANFTNLNIISDNGGGSVGGVNGGRFVGLYVCTVTAPGTGAANTLVYTATGQTAGSTDVFVSQTSSILLLDEEKKQDDEIVLLKNQVCELGRMMKALLVQIPSDEEKDCEVIMRVPEKAAATVSSEKTLSSITDLGVRAPSNSRNGTPLSDITASSKKSYFGFTG